MSSPLCYRVTFWEALPGLSGLLSSSLVHGSQEHETHAAAEEAAILGVQKGAARADLLAVYRRSSRRLGSYSQGAPGLSAAWWPA